MRTLRCRTADGKRTLYYRKETVDYVPAEGEPSDDQKAVAALVDLPQETRDARAREVFEKGPFFEMLTYFGAVDISLTCYVDRNGEQNASIDVTVDAARVKDYAGFLDAISSPYSKQVREDTLKIDAEREPPASNIAEVRIRTTQAVSSLESAERFLSENSKFT
jgi:hypothetical protein